jgi:hypothetical protein
MLAKITFQGYEKQDFNFKDQSTLLIEFTLPIADTEKIQNITDAIESAYEYGNPISWTIQIDHEYI